VHRTNDPRKVVASQVNYLLLEDPFVKYYRFYIFDPAFKIFVYYQWRGLGIPRN
jgi:hypothetical protein